MLQPQPQQLQQSSAEPVAPPTASDSPSMMTPTMPGMQNTADETQQAPSDEEIEAHLDRLGEDDKNFLAEHLTPEFVRAIGLISGPEVAKYLDQFADKDKVLVPVPRQVAEEYLAKEQQSQSAPQGQPQAPQAAPQGPMPQASPAAPAPQMPPQGMMAPR